MSKGNLINVSTLDLSKTITNFSENVQVDACKSRTQKVPFNADLQALLLFYQSNFGRIKILKCPDERCTYG